MEAIATLLALKFVLETLNDLNLSCYVIEMPPGDLVPRAYWSQPCRRALSGGPLLLNYTSHVGRLGLKGGVSPLGKWLVGRQLVKGEHMAPIIIVLSNILRGSVIVLDNASYHSRKLEYLPSTSWKKDRIEGWLTSKNINFDNDCLKRDLLFLVHQVQKDFEKFKVDELAKSTGCSVLRLPPYHCELNPIEMVWAQITHYVSKNNTTFKKKSVERLISDSVGVVYPENWLFVMANNWTDAVKIKIAVKSNKKSGISTVLDGTEDDILFDDSDPSQSINDSDDTDDCRELYGFEEVAGF
ncbi:hypothetical protein J437_LFUL001694 [Ladona fulva]|uniref:Tc1-like transposase DDE domain-containing protein n=1 Tax=Ladona fulva TaxID=123851 RepID=A0A8K0NWJ6_LADFU|nr:hypothetical protein J437_LFUL001694 [Ladona fulva]